MCFFLLTQMTSISGIAFITWFFLKLPARILSHRSVNLSGYRVSFEFVFWGHFSFSVIFSVAMTILCERNSYDKIRKPDNGYFDN